MLLTVGSNSKGITMRRDIGWPMTPGTAAILISTGLVAYAAWLTSIVFSASNGHQPLLIAAAAFFPVGIVHGVGIWFGGW
jgi:hypothetical protein